MKVSVEFARLAEADKWRRNLSEGERGQADRKTNPIAKAKFEVGRGLRRKMLSEGAGLVADELCFVDGDGGKPRVMNADGWDFNISHSGDFVVVAVAWGAVGVDIEKIRPVRDMEAIVARYFHRDEGIYWRSLAVGLREGAFFVLWSAREAAMKCTGRGLARGLAVTRVDPAIVNCAEAGAQVGERKLRLRRIEAPDGYVAVVAVMPPR